jgi:DNA-binding MarR family transcriptional regulator
MRIPDPSDGRAKIVLLMERGWAVDRAAREIGGQVEAEWARSLGEERVHQLRQTLSDLSDQLGG